jgi:hypothetical protein
MTPLALAVLSLLALDPTGDEDAIAAQAPALGLGPAQLVAVVM